MTFPVVDAVAESITDNSSTTHAVTMPGGSAGILVTFFMVDNSSGNGAATPPSGWSSIKIDLAVGGGGAAALSIAFKESDGGEGAIENWTTAGPIGEKSVHTTYRITGHADPTSQPPESSTGITDTGSDVNPDPDAITPTGGSKDYLFIAAAGNDQQGKITSGYPTNYSNGKQNANIGSGGVNLGTAERQLNSASENPGVFTLISAARWAALTLAIHPGPSNAESLGATHAAQSDVTTFIQTQTFEVDADNQTQQVEATSFTQTHIISVNDANHTQQVDASNVAAINPPGSNHAQQSDVVSFDQGQILITAGAAHTHEAIAPNVQVILVDPATVVPGAHTILLIRIRPWNAAGTRTVVGAPNAFGSKTFAGGGNFIAGGVPSAVYLSDHGFTSDPDDSLPVNIYWEGRLQSGYNFESSLFRGEEPEGRSQVGQGEIVVTNSDGFYDSILNYGWDGRTLEAWTGQSGAAFSTFTKKLEVTVQSIEWSEGVLTFKVRDKRFNTERSIAVNLYEGSGGLDGNSDIANFPKPQVYGEQYNVRATLVDPTNLIYQVHDRLTSAIFAVRDKGVALSADGNVTTVSILTTSVSAGTYVTSLSTGVFKLGASPSGLITADVRGDAVGGYVSTTAAIARRIVTSRLTGQQLSDPEDLDVASITALVSSQSATVGIAINPGRTTADVLDDLLIAIGGFWYFTRTGKFALGRLESPADLISTRTVITDEISSANPLRRTGAVPSWRRRVAWKQLGIAQSPDALAGGVSDDDRAFYSQISRFSEASDSSIRTTHKLAQDKVTPSLFAASADAEEEASRLLTLHKVTRHFYEVGVVDSMFQFSLAQVITLTYSRFDLTSGKKFIVVGVSEIYEMNETVLTLWG